MFGPSIIALIQFGYRFIIIEITMALSAFVYLGKQTENYSNIF